MTGYASVDWSSARVETARLLLRPLHPQDADQLRTGTDGRPWLRSETRPAARGCVPR